MNYISASLELDGFGLNGGLATCIGKKWMEDGILCCISVYIPIPLLFWPVKYDSINNILLYMGSLKTDIFGNGMV